MHLVLNGGDAKKVEESHTMLTVPFLEAKHHLPEASTGTVEYYRFKIYRLKSIYIHRCKPSNWLKEGRMT